MDDLIAPRVGRSRPHEAIAWREAMDVNGRNLAGVGKGRRLVARRSIECRRPLKARFPVVGRAICAERPCDGITDALRHPGGATDNDGVVG